MQFRITQLLHNTKIKPVLRRDVLHKEPFCINCEKVVNVNVIQRWLYR